MLSCVQVEVWTAPEAEQAGSAKIDFSEIVTFRGQLRCCAAALRCILGSSTHSHSQSFSRPAAVAAWLITDSDRLLQAMKADNGPHRDQGNADNIMATGYMKTNGEQVQADRVIENTGEIALHNVESDEDEQGNLYRFQRDENGQLGRSDVHRQLVAGTGSSGRTSGCYALAVADSAWSWRRCRSMSLTGYDPTSPSPSPPGPLILPDGMTPTSSPKPQVCMRVTPPSSPDSDWLATAGSACSGADDLTRIVAGDSRSLSWPPGSSEAEVDEVVVKRTFETREEAQACQVTACANRDAEVENYKDGPVPTGLQSNDDGGGQICLNSALSQESTAASSSNKSHFDSDSADHCKKMVILPLHSTLPLPLSSLQPPRPISVVTAGEKDFRPQCFSLEYEEARRASAILGAKAMLAASQRKAAFATKSRNMICSTECSATTGLHQPKALARISVASPVSLEATAAYGAPVGTTCHRSSRPGNSADMSVDSSISMTLAKVQKEVVKEATLAKLGKSPRSPPAEEIVALKDIVFFDSALAKPFDEILSKKAVANLTSSVTGDDEVDNRRRHEYEKVKTKTLVSKVDDPTFACDEISTSATPFISSKANSGIFKTLNRGTEISDCMEFEAEVVMSFEGAGSKDISSTSKGESMVQQCYSENREWAEVCGQLGKVEHTLNSDVEMSALIPGSKFMDPEISTASAMAKSRPDSERRDHRADGAEIEAAEGDVDQPACIRETDCANTASGEWMGWCGPYFLQDGRQYWYHAGKKISTWEKPPEFMTEREKR